MPTHATPEQQTWQRLVTYHRLAQLRAAAHDRADHAGDSWCALPVHDRELLTGERDELALHGRCARFVGAVDDQDVLIGWPTLVLVGQESAPTVVPLFVTRLSAVGEADPSSGSLDVAPDDDQPYLNPTLLAHPALDPAVSAELGTLATDLPFERPDAMRGLAERICTLLELPLQAAPAGVTDAPPPARAGAYDVAVLVRSSATLQMTRALLDELATLSSRVDWSSTAARWLVQAPEAGREESPAAPSHHLPPVQVTGLELNDSQEQALADALERPLTVVTGPPGTGKSQLVAAIVANQWVRGRSVLVASSNNTAVDVAVGKASSIDPALLLRAGSSEHRTRLASMLEGLAARGHRDGPSRDVIERQLTLAAEGRQAVLDRLERHAGAEAELARLLTDLDHRTTMIWPDADGVPDAAHETAIRRAAGKASRARWWRATRRRALLRVARASATGVHADDVLAWAVARERAEALITWLESVGPRDPDADRAELEATARSWSKAGTDALSDSVDVAMRNGRVAMQHFARTRERAPRERAAAFHRVREHLLGWATTALSVRGTVPLQAGLFDLLVIDEASQCSLAHVLPLAYRARRIVVVGDPNQLMPIVTLTGKALDGVARVAGADEQWFRQGRVSALAESVFTAYEARAERTHLLDEHYRCHPSIAGSINEQFYGGLLRILTDVGAADRGVHGLHLLDVPGRTTRTWNDDEVDAVVRWVVEHPDETGTLGVVTPFREQRRRLEAALRRALGDDAWARRRVVVGTAHAFQGEERDLMLFSTVLAADAPVRTAQWVEDQRNLVNVAVSRAKRALVVVTDVAALSGVPVPTLHALVAAAQGTANGNRAAEELLDTWSGARGLHSEAERRLFEALSRRGVVPRVKPVVEGYELDFALDGSGGPVDVEVDGTQHGDVRGRLRRQDLRRDAVLERMGWRVVRVPAWRCLREPDDVAAEVAETVVSRGPGFRR